MTKMTMESKVRRPYTYPWTDENKAAVPYYINNLFEATTSGTVVYMLPNAIEHSEILPYQAQLFSMFGSGKNTIPMLEFFNNPSRTALDLFKSYKTYYETNGKLIK